MKFGFLIFLFTILVFNICMKSISSMSGPNLEEEPAGFDPFSRDVINELRREKHIAVNDRLREELERQHSYNYSVPDYFKLLGSMGRWRTGKSLAENPILRRVYVARWGIPRAASHSRASHEDELTSEIMKLIRDERRFNEIFHYFQEEIHGGGITLNERCRNYGIPFSRCD